MRRPWVLSSPVLRALLCAAASALAQDDERFVTVLGPDSQGARFGVRAQPEAVCVQLSNDDRNCALPAPNLARWALDRRRGGPSRRVR